MKAVGRAGYALATGQKAKAAADAILLAEGWAKVGAQKREELVQEARDAAAAARTATVNARAAAARSQTCTSDTRADRRQMGIELEVAGIERSVRKIASVLERAMRKNRNRREAQ